MSSTDLGTSEDTVVNTTSSSASGSPSTTPSVITLNQPSPTSSNVIQLTALTTATATARTENCMSTPGPPEWRPYAYEHPLTAATTAMLNINGGGSDDPSSSGFGILYDYHYSKLESLGSASASDLIKSENKLSADIWSPVVVTNVLSGGNGNSSSKHTNGEMTEIFVPSSTIQSSSAKLTSVLRRGAGADSKLGTKLNGHRYTNGDSSSLSPPSEHHQHNSHTHNHSPLSNSNGNGVIIVKEEIAHSPDHDQHAQYRSPQLFATLSNPSHGGGGSTFDFGTGGNGTSVVVSSAQFISSLRGGAPNTNGGSMTNIYPVGTSPSDPYYRVDYFANEFGASGVTTASRQLSPYDGAGTDGPSFVDRYVRPGGPYKPHGGLPVDLPSPDSGIGTEAITPRDHSNIQQGFDYTDLCHPGLINDIGTNSNNTEGRLSPGGTTHPNLKRPWHDFGRQNETDKIQIPKLFSNYGLRYYLESPISTSQRREDDRITYINKGQFYGITLEYIPDPEKPIKSQTVKTVVMLVFREEKSPEDEIKAWQFWHGRQHSVKQRILDADTKNSVGLVGCIDEIAHNAIAVYWNPHESSAKINVAVQCLSTDFSSQKGVKGLPLHLQIDTYEDPRDPNCPVFHRGYGQIKVFCDKGAERKTRDEERRAAKRKLTATGRKKLDEMYHSSCDRSEFYTMSDTSKPPVLFTPAEDLDKLTSLELHGFYNTNSEGSDHTGEKKSEHHQHGGVLVIGSGLDPAALSTNNSNSVPTPNGGSIVSNDNSNVYGSSSSSSSVDTPIIKRMRLPQPTSERLMLYARQESEDTFTPLHLVPPTTMGLLSALEEKYKISMSSVKNLYRRNSKGIVAKIDDDMLRHYCHEDSFLLDVKPSENEDAFDVTLTELADFPIQIQST